MKLSLIMLSLLLLAGICLVGCDKSVGPTTDNTIDPNHEPDMDNLAAAAWPRTHYPPPAPLVTVNIDTDAVEFWPYTGANLSGEPKDPINLIFFGEADLRDIRAALLALDGDRTAFGIPAAPPFNSTWDDAMGDIQASYGKPDGWTPSAIQLACGDYMEARVHLRLFKVGRWTLGGAHFEVLIPGTTDHQVLSWEVAEQFVKADFVRSGLLDPDTPPFPTGPINDSPFRTIPSVIYNGLPPELRGLIGGPMADVTEDVPIGTDGQATVIYLAEKTERVAEVREQTLLIDFNQVIPKPFCSSGPYDYVYVTGPVTLTQTSRLTEWGVYNATFRAHGELAVTPVDPMTGQPVGETLTARVKEFHNSLFGKRTASTLSLRYQALHPFTAPGAGWFFERLNISSRGSDGYQLITRCESSQTASQELIATAGEIDVDGEAMAKRLVSIQ